MFKFRLFGAVGKHLTWRQRAVGISFDLKHLIQAPLALIYLALPFTLLCGYPFVLWSDMQQLKILIRLVSVHMLCRWGHQMVLVLIASRVNKQFDVRLPSYDTDLEQFLSPYIFVAYIRSFILPAKLGGKKTGFTSTGSIASAMDERSKENRVSLPRRVWIVVVHQMAWVHLLFILAIVAGVTLTLLRCFLPDGLERIRSAYIIGNAITTREKLIYLITRLGWPPLFWLQSTVSALTPFVSTRRMPELNRENPLTNITVSQVYAICPPTVPNREDLLDRDPKTGIAYPKETSKRLQKTKLGSWRYWRGGFVILYTWALLIGSAWL